MKNRVKRCFYPGEEWVYVKIYIGMKSCDDFLIDVMYPLSIRLEKSGLISHWFFIRYSDPDFHVRYRLRLSDVELFHVVVNLINRKLNRNTVKFNVYRIVYDTYNRELERYREELMEISERIFHENSKLVCRLIKRIKGFDENYRWMSAFVMIDNFLSASGLSLKEKQAFIDVMDSSFKKEFGFCEHNSKQLNVIYRSKQRMIFDVLNRTVSDRCFIKLYSLLDGGIKTSVIESGLNHAAFIHMSMNRLFPVKNRVYELLIYNFLNRYYKSMLVINRR